MKKLLALFVAGLMTLSLTACGSDVNNKEKTLTVATVDLSGDFIDGFGNSSYDVNIRNMIHGYETVAVEDDGTLVFNKTSVKNVEEVEESNGDKTFTFTLNDGMVWNDNTPITANDYVFAVLFEASKAFAEAGATVSTADSLLGYAAYNTGEADVFAGIQLIDDSTFSLTVDGEQLPYFYEMWFTQVFPRPMHVYGEGAEIVSDANGSKISGIDLAAATINIASTYRYTPTVTCGPYNFEKFENGQVVLKLNDKYLGDYDGSKPSIGTVVVKEVSQTNDIDALINGEVDIVEGVVEGEKIEKAKATSTLTYSEYSRNGYGHVAMANDFSVTADPAIRRAINFVIDKDSVISTVLGGYGSPVNGDYGKSQWMYQANKSAVDALNYYSFSIENANKELDTTDFKFEADGTTAWNADKALDAKDYYRYNSKGEVLAINHLGTESNVVTDSLEVIFLDNYPKVGVKFSIDRTDFAGLLDNYYYGYKLGDARKYHTFNLATSFNPVYDPYYNYASKYFHTSSNPTGVNSTEADELMMNMRELASSDKEGYAAAWLEWQQWFNTNVPVAPIYANQYFDFYNANLEGVDTGPMKKWSSIISRISFVD